ncbi:hypothetical protein DT019_08840 [Streptomyces sp. SDr-06]|nr:hypothetical protein DT019_08840 [Streptomyces sp. SDr-06]
MAGGVALGLAGSVGEGDGEGVAAGVLTTGGFFGSGLSSSQPVVVRASAPSTPVRSRVRTAGLDMRMRRLSRTIGRL